MELPFGTEGRKATHDFLSLYSSSSAHAAQQDPAPPQVAGGYLKTHDFLRPLERVGKNAMTTQEDNRGGVAGVEKPPVPCPPASVGHLLPGGIGTFSICYINQRALKPERSLFTTTQTSSTVKNDENSNCSSYSAGGFSLWDESAVQKGKTGNENIAAERHALQGANVVGGQWPPLLNNSSSSNHNPINAATFSSFSSSPLSTSQKSQSFMDMMTSSKNDHDEDDEDDDDEFVVKKESSPHPKGNLSVKVEAKTVDQKPNTPRSKHSATEQRRRSKINDRFLKLREVIPNSDQKRDKASFLLEVIEYIQFLQEKVNRYESSYNAWNHEPSKIMHWRNRHIPEGFINRMQGAKPEHGPALVFTDENKSGATSSIPINGQTLIDTDASTATTLKGRGQQLELPSKTAPVHPTIQSNIFALGRTGVAVSPISPNEASDMDQMMTLPQSQFLQERTCTPDHCTPAGNKTNDQGPTIESGTINVSSIYSQGLLNTLTQALCKSGVDLSQASLSVQIDLGKRANGVPLSSSPAAKEDNISTALPHAQATTTGDFDPATKKLRTC